MKMPSRDHRDIDRLLAKLKAGWMGYDPEAKEFYEPVSERLSAAWQGRKNRPGSTGILKSMATYPALIPALLGSAATLNRKTMGKYGEPIAGVEDTLAQLSAKHMPDFVNRASDEQDEAYSKAHNDYGLDKPQGLREHAVEGLGEMLSQLPLPGPSKVKMANSAVRAIPEYLGPFIRPHVADYAIGTAGGAALGNMSEGMEDKDMQSEAVHKALSDLYDKYTGPDYLREDVPGYADGGMTYNDPGKDINWYQTYGQGPEFNWANYNAPSQLVLGANPPTGPVPTLTGGPSNLQAGLDIGKLGSKLYNQLNPPPATIGSQNMGQALNTTDLMRGVAPAGASAAGAGLGSFGSGALGGAGAGALDTSGLMSGISSTAPASTAGQALDTSGLMSGIDTSGISSADTGGGSAAAEGSSAGVMSYLGAALAAWNVYKNSQNYAHLEHSLPTPTSTDMQNQESALLNKANLQNVRSGMMQGATAGSSWGPLGMGIGALIGGIGSDQHIGQEVKGWTGLGGTDTNNAPQTIMNPGAAIGDKLGAKQNTLVGQILNPTYNVGNFLGLSGTTTQGTKDYQALKGIDPSGGVGKTVSDPQMSGALYNAVKASSKYLGDTAQAFGTDLSHDGIGKTGEQLQNFIGGQLQTLATKYGWTDPSKINGAQVYKTYIAPALDQYISEKTGKAFKGYEDGVTQGGSFNNIMGTVTDWQLGKLPNTSTPAAAPAPSPGLNYQQLPVMGFAEGGKVQTLLKMVEHLGLNPHTDAKFKHNMLEDPVDNIKYAANELKDAGKITPENHAALNELVSKYLNEGTVTDEAMADHLLDLHQSLFGPGPQATHVLDQTLGSLDAPISSAHGKLNKWPWE